MGNAAAASETAVVAENVLVQSNGTMLMVVVSPAVVVERKRSFSMSLSSSVKGMSSVRNDSWIIENGGWVVVVPMGSTVVACCCCMMMLGRGAWDGGLGEGNKGWMDGL